MKRETSFCCCCCFVQFVFSVCVQHSTRVLFCAGPWTSCSCTAFTVRPLDHTQRFVKGWTGLLGHFLFNLVPDGNFETLQEKEANYFNIVFKKQYWKADLLEMLIAHLFQLLLLNNLCLLWRDNSTFDEENKNISSSLVTQCVRARVICDIWWISI